MAAAQAKDGGVPTWATLYTKNLPGNAKKVHTVGWSCDGAKVASGSQDKKIRVWSVDSKTSRFEAPLELQGHSQAVDQLCWDPIKPDRLASASLDRTVRLWDTKTGKNVGTVRTEAENLNLAWSPNGLFIAVGDTRNQVSIIDCKSAQVIKSVKFTSDVNQLTWNKSSELIFLTTGLGTVEILSAPDLQVVHSFQAHLTTCSCIHLEPHGQYLAVGGTDAIVSVWEVNEFSCVRTFAKLDLPVRAVCFSFDGKYIAAASEDKVIDIYDVFTGQSVDRIPCSGIVNSLSWHPSLYLLVFALDIVGNNVLLHGSWQAPS